MLRYSSLEQSLHMLQAEESRLDDEKAAAKAKYAAYEKQKLVPLLPPQLPSFTSD